ncbi:MAG: hypothetical protein Q9M31_00865 [Mariprofundus sp.]|nr:hypothetical protein [Mariprofundus sp.]
MMKKYWAFLMKISVSGSGLDQSIFAKLSLFTQSRLGFFSVWTVASMALCALSAGALFGMAMGESLLSYVVFGGVFLLLLLLQAMLVSTGTHRRGEAAKQRKIRISRCLLFTLFSMIFSLPSLLYLQNQLPFNMVVGDELEALQAENSEVILIKQQQQLNHAIIGQQKLFAHVQQQLWTKMSLEMIRVMPEMKQASGCFALAASKPEALQRQWLSDCIGGKLLFLQDQLHHQHDAFAQLKAAQKAAAASSSGHEQVTLRYFSKHLFDPLNQLFLLCMTIVLAGGFLLRDWIGGMPEYEQLVFEEYQRFMADEYKQQQPIHEAFCLATGSDVIESLASPFEQAAKGDDL